MDFHLVVYKLLSEHYIPLQYYFLFFQSYINKTVILLNQLHVEYIHFLHISFNANPIRGS